MGNLTDNSPPQLGFYPAQSAAYLSADFAADLTGVVKNSRTHSAEVNMIRASSLLTIGFVDDKFSVPNRR
jgi:hypothetical protein